MKRSVRVICTLIIVLAVMISGWYIFNELKKAYVEQKKIEFIKSGIGQLEHLLETIGLSQDHEYVQELQKRITQVQHELQELTRSWHVSGVVAVHRNSWIAKLKKQLTVQRDLFHNYQQQLHNLAQLGKDTQQEAAFARQELEHAQQQIEKLENLVLHCNGHVSPEDIVQLQEVVQVNQQMLKNYKHKIDEYLNTGTSEDDPKIQFERDQALKTAIEIGDIEQCLYYSDHSTL